VAGSCRSVALLAVRRNSILLWVITGQPIASNLPSIPGRMDLGREKIIRSRFLGKAGMHEDQDGEPQ
jgi:hypothetical protein